MSQHRTPSLAHVVYRTRRFEQMLAWYKDVFHARVRHQNPALAFLTYDDEHHRLAFVDLAVIQPGVEDSANTDLRFRCITPTLTATSSSSRLTASRPRLRATTTFVARASA